MSQHVIYLKNFVELRFSRKNLDITMYDPGTDTKKKIAKFNSKEDLELLLNLLKEKEE